MTEELTNEKLAVAIGPEVVRRLVEQGREIKLLDVRTPGEFESAHIRGAYNVPLDTLGEHGEELRRHVRGTVVLVCRSGNRARKAEEALRELGMENLHVLDGGMTAWEAAGNPVRQSGRQRWSLERQVRLTAGSLVVLGALGSLMLAQPLAWLAAFVGAGLTFSAVTDTCGMAMLLSRLPYNRPAGCDVRAVVRALSSGASAPGVEDEAAAAQCA